MMFIKAGTFLDGTGSTPQRDATILVDGDAIKAINPQEIPADAERLDFSGKTVTPGLINAHIHLEMRTDEDANAYYARASEAELALNAYEHLRQYLRSGVTYVRSLGSIHNIDIKLRELLKRGVIQGPGIVAAGANIVMTGGHGWIIGRECDGVDECRKAARAVCKSGADVVKFMATGGVLTPGMEPGSPQLTLEEIRAIVDEAHKAGRKTTAHAQGATGIQNALDAGSDCIEHGVFLSDKMIDQMLRQDTYLVPTLQAPWAIIKHGIEGGIPEYGVRKSEEIYGAHMTSFKNAYKAGVKIAMGTDAGTPFNFHYNSWFELKLMQEAADIPGGELVAMATGAAADLLGIAANYGTLEPGKKADILVLDDNPLDDIEAFSRVHAVFKHGQRVAL